jgi:ubiquinone/menaquinone biosynthesis C-methylase UbiE
MSIEKEHLAGKIILEVGSGRGDTTRKLVDLLSGHAGAQLIATDISDTFFQTLEETFQAQGVQVRFICTRADELLGIPTNSIDYIVCNYTLCAVNSEAGLAALALRRFWEVLKAGGKLFVEEEFPISKQGTSAQEIWAEKWRILKSAMILVGKFPYNEIEPVTLERLCRLAGFEDVIWTAYSETYHDAMALDFFQKRLKAILPQLSNESLRTGFSKMALDLHNRASQSQIGVMEVPFYRLIAQKRHG